MTVKTDISKLDPKNFIIIKGASMHNLKSIDVAIPRNKLVVITGLSGSGKSSLAFDTLYAEGQRRYVESLSSYARQFIGRMDKPEVDYILGISPAIAIQQKVNSRNPRSTVGTSTEIYDYLKLLFARIGRTVSPVSGKDVKKDSISDVVDFLSSQLNCRFLIATDLTRSTSKSLADELQILLQKGFTRLLKGTEIVDIEQVVLENQFVVDDNKLVLVKEKKPKTKAKTTTKKIELVEDEKFIDATYQLLIDRVAIGVEFDEEISARLADSIQTAYQEGHGLCCVYNVTDKLKPIKTVFSNRFELDGILFE